MSEKVRLLKTEGILAPVEPLAVPMLEAVRLSGLSKSELYRRMAEGQIQAVKSGVRTLIVMASLKDYVANLPPATFRRTNRAA